MSVMSYSIVGRSAIYPIFLPFLACKTKCVFCEQAQITSKSSFDNIVSFSQENMELLYEAIKSQLDTYKSYYNHNSYSEDSINIEVAFYGGSFSCIKYDVRKKLYNVAIEHLKLTLNVKNLYTTIRYSTRPDCILQNSDIELEEEHRVFNLRTIELGVQTLTDNALAKNKRPYSSKDVVNAITKLFQNDFSFNIGIQLMPGMYGDTPIDFINSVINLTSLAKQHNSKNRIEYARIYPCLVLKNTELERIYNLGEYSPLDKIETIALSTISFILLESAGIRVIRIELPPMEDSSSGGKIVAGYYHQALGDLVRTFSLYLYIMLFVKDSTTIFINSKDNSKMNGYKGIIGSLLKSKKCTIEILEQTKNSPTDDNLFIIDYYKISLELVNYVLLHYNNNFISFYDEIVNTVKVNVNRYSI